MRHKIRNLVRRIRLTSNERKLLQIGLQVTEEYVSSRKFRRKIKDTLTNEALVEILGNWDDKN